MKRGTNYQLAEAALSRRQPAEASPKTTTGPASKKTSRKLPIWSSSFGNNNDHSVRKFNEEKSDPSEGSVKTNCSWKRKQTHSVCIRFPIPVSERGILFYSPNTNCSLLHLSVSSASETPFQRSSRVCRFSASPSCSPRNSSLFLSSTPWARARRWRSSPTNHTLSLLTFRVFFYSSVDLHSPAKSQSSHLSKKNKMIRNYYSPVISTLLSFRTGNGMKSSSSPRPKEENMAS
ncbi:unnamed protein product [Musa acuminata subsp. burmannicoides]